MPPKAKAAGRAKAKADPRAKAKGKAKAKAEPKSKAKAKAKAATAKRVATPSGEGAKRVKGSDGGARASSSSGTGKAGGRTADSRCPKSGLKVYEDLSFTLNQTNVGANNNKYYIIQVLHGDGQYHAWNRWGRVGDPGATKLQSFSDPAQAVKAAKSKFREKTGNDMDNLDSFVKKPGLYAFVETEDAGESSEAPMGKLSESQIKKGQAVLEKLETAMNKRKESDINEFSSQFYSLIPTNFGWKKPVAITTVEMLAEKQELLKFLMRMGFEKVEAEENLTPIDGLLQLPVPKTLDEAASGICGKASVASSNKQGRALHAKNAGKPKSSMNEAMYGAIMLYTSNAIYADLNKCLRDKNRTKIQKYFKYLRLLFEAMNCLSGQKKVLWRGLGVDLSGDEMYKPGNSVTWWGVSSCTSEMSVARGFAGSCSGGATVMMIQCKNACDISAMSFYSHEKESLLRPGTVLKIKSRTKKGNITDIVAEEVGLAIK